MSAKILQLSGGKHSYGEREAAPGLSYPSANTGRAPSPQPLPALGWQQEGLAAKLCRSIRWAGEGTAGYSSVIQHLGF